MLLVFKSDEGIWKSVVEPVFETVRRFEFTPADVVEPMVKTAVFKDELAA